MLPFKNRLTKKREIEKVLREGQSFFSENLILKKLINETEITRFCFLVGTKFSKKAVERNQAKRILREAIRTQLEKIKKGFDVTIGIKRVPGEKIKRGKATMAVMKILKKADLFN